MEENDTGLGEEQLSFLSEMLGEVPNEVDDSKPAEIDTEIQAKVDEEVQSIEEPKGDVGENLEKESQEPDEQDEAYKTIESLREQILALSQAVGVDPKMQTVQEDVKADSEAVAPTDTKATIEQFLTADELDRLIDEPALINVAFTRSFTAMQANVQASIQREVNRQIMVNKAVTDFYQENNDLLPYSKFVQFVMAEVEQTNRDKPYNEIFKTTADECRKRLGLSIGAKAPTRESNNGSQKPAFAGSKKSNSRPGKQDSFFSDDARDVFNVRD